MKNFKYERAETFAEAGELLKSNENACVLAGGTDLLGTLKTEILCENPEMLVDLKRIPNAKGIKDEGDGLSLGALTTLTEIEESAAVQEKAPMLAEAAHSIASPLIRNKGTVGGNLCQDVRCWFYRYPHEGGGRMVCRRKGGDHCYAEQGDNRYHSIYGGVRIGTTACKAACPRRNGYFRLHGADPPGQLCRCGTDPDGREPHAHGHQPRVHPSVPGRLQPERPW